MCRLLLTPHMKARPPRLDGLVRVQGEDHIVKRRGRMRKEDSTEQVLPAMMRLPESLRGSQVKKRLSKLNTLLQRS